MKKIKKLLLISVILMNFSCYANTKKEYQKNRDTVSACINQPIVISFQFIEAQNKRDLEAISKLIKMDKYVINVFAIPDSVVVNLNSNELELTLEKFQRLNWKLCDDKNNKKCYFIEPNRIKNLRITQTINDESSIIIIEEILKFELEKINSEWKIISWSKL